MVDDLENEQSDELTLEDLNFKLNAISKTLNKFICVYNKNQLAKRKKGKLSNIKDVGIKNSILRAIQKFNKDQSKFETNLEGKYFMEINNQRSNIPFDRLKIRTI